MIELVFVIVVIGILSAVMIPRIDRDNVFEATQQVVSHIKYAQHLAMTENVYDDVNNTWFQERWKIEFETTCAGYSIYSNKNHNTTAERTEAAVDPQTRKRLFSNGCVEDPQDHDYVLLSSKFDINTVALSPACGGQDIAFDHLGRPYSANALNGVLKQNCDITLTSGSGQGSVIRIVPETGYTYVLNYF